MILNIGSMCHALTHMHRLVSIILTSMSPYTSLSRVHDIKSDIDVPPTIYHYTSVIDFSYIMWDHHLLSRLKTFQQCMF